MSDQELKIDDASIDRLVDGELPSDERRRLLLSLEAQPDGWRRCALAFVEAQVWRDQMRGVLADSVQEERHSHIETAVQRHASSAPAVSNRGVTRRYAGLWLATAASLLVAFGLGRQSGVIERQSLRNAPLAAGRGDPAAAADAGVGEPASTGDAVTLVVNDHLGLPHRLNVPLVEGRQLGAEFAETPNWSSPELVQRLDERGLGFAARRRYVPLYFEQQNQQIPFIVPVDDALFTPVSRPVF